MSAKNYKIIEELCKERAKQTYEKYMQDANEALEMSNLLEIIIKVMQEADNRGETSVPVSNYNNQLDFALNNMGIVKYTEIGSWIDEEPKVVWVWNKEKYNASRE